MYVCSAFRVSTSACSLVQPLLDGVDELGHQGLHLVPLLGRERREHVLGPVAHPVGQRPHADPEASVGLRLQCALDAPQAVVTARRALRTETKRAARDLEVVHEDEQVGGRVEGGVGAERRQRRAAAVHVGGGFEQAGGGGGPPPPPRAGGGGGGGGGPPPPPPPPPPHPQEHHTPPPPTHYL